MLGLKIWTIYCTSNKIVYNGAFTWLNKEMKTAPYAYVGLPWKSPLFESLSQETTKIFLFHFLNSSPIKSDVKYFFHLLWLFMGTCNDWDKILLWWGGLFLSTFNFFQFLQASSCNIDTVFLINLHQQNTILTKQLMWTVQHMFVVWLSHGALQSRFMCFLIPWWTGPFQIFILSMWNQVEQPLLPIRHWLGTWFVGQGW